MEQIIYNTKGKEAGKINLPEEIFSVKWNADLVYQVAVSMQANKRAGTANTKDRSEVTATGKKPWKQKGTGRARHGSRVSPIWVGGGIAHGPRSEKDYSKKINKKMRAKALFVALSEKLRKGKILFVDNLNVGEIKTKLAASAISSLGQIKGFERLEKPRKVIAHFAIPKIDITTKKSLRNLDKITFSDAKDLNVVDVLNREYLVVTDPEVFVSIMQERNK